MNRLIIFAVIILLIVIIIGCAKLKDSRQAGVQINNITPEQLHEKIQREEDFILVDVRTPSEHRAGHIPNSLLIPLGELETRKGELDPEKEIVIYCQAGVRSYRAAKKLRSLGFTKITNVLSGYAHWQRINR